MSSSAPRGFLRPSSAAHRLLKNFQMNNKRAGRRPARIWLMLPVSIALIIGVCFIPLFRARAASSSLLDSSFRLLARSTPLFSMLLAETDVDLSVSKVTSQQTAKANTDVTYTIEVRNFGPADANGITLNDTLPENMTFVSLQQNSGPALSCTVPQAGSGGTINCTAGSFPVNSVAVFTLVGHIPSGTSVGTEYGNTATVSTGSVDPNSVNNSSTATTTVVTDNADVNIIKSTPSETAQPNSDVTYTIEVRNGGPAAADNFQWQDPLPAGMTFVSLQQNSGPALSCTTPLAGSGGTITCTSPSFAANSVAVFTLVGHIPPETEGTFFTNVATVSTTTVDPNTENNSSNAIILVAANSADVGITKSSTSTTARPDTNVTYTIEVRNGGPNAAENFEWRDTLPGDMTFVSLQQNSGPALSCTMPAVGAGGLIRCISSSFAANSVATFTLVGHIPSGTPADIEYENTATVSTSTQDPNIENNSSTITTTVITCDAATLVNTSADSGAGSLRQAILDTCKDGTITFAPSLSFNPVTLTSGELLINRNLTIQGQGANLLTVRRGTGSPNFRILNITAGITVTISGLTISNGNAGSGSSGGGINNGGTLTLKHVAISGNSADGSGGGINNTGTLNLTNSTISGNSAVLNGGGINNAGTLTLMNSTISGNNANGSGGGIYSSSGATLTNVTITNNRADFNNSGDVNSGGGIFVNGGTFILRNTIVAGNFTGTGSTADDINPTGVDSNSSFNLIGTGGSGGLINNTNNNQVGVANPGLGTLANNGGPTQTHALLKGSAALDGGSNAHIATDPFDLDSDGDTGETLPYDQRGLGFQRIADSADANTTQVVDIGAYEAQVSIEDIADKATNEDTPLSFSFNVGDATLITSVTATSSNATLVPNDTAHLSISGSGSTRTLNISPAANITGTTTITVTVNGSSSQTMSDTFVLTVNPINDAPQALNDAYSTAENTVLNVAAPGVLTNDTDIDSATLTAIKVSDPSHGTVTLNSNGSFVYTPQAGFSGTDSFTYKANDGSLDSNTATVTITVSEGGTLQFSAATYNVVENAGNATITITRAGGSAGTATVLFQTSNGTAGSTDYTSVSTTITFNNGEVSKTVNVPITDDPNDEADETINLTLSSAGGSGQLGTPSTAVLTINDDDAAPSISINDASVTEGNSGTTNAVFTVTLSAASNLTVNVDFATANGTATTAGSDYQSNNGTLTFAPGETQKSITVLVNGDTGNEPNETFFVNLSNAQNATVSDNQGLGTILNDDAPGVQLSSNSYTFSEGAGHGDIIVTRTGDISQALTVDYQTSDQSGATPCQTNNNGFASDRCDYTTASGTLRFAAGEAQKTIQLVLIDDAYVEPSEQLNIQLTNPQGATLGSIAAATITITSNDTQVATQNPIDDLDFFLRQQYADFLGREPDAAGFAFWKARMTGNCPAGQTCDRIDTSLRFFGSDEFRERGYFVYLFYHAALGRRPTYAEWILDVSKLNGFQTIAEQNANKDEFVNEFVSRQEFMNLYNGFQTGQTFVDALIQKSGVTPASRQSLIDNYATIGRAETVQAFIETPEVQAAFVDRGFVTMLYFGYLRRDAEPGGFDFWMQKLIDTNRDYRTIVGGFLNSDEYRFRFAQIPANP